MESQHSPAPAFPQNAPKLLGRNDSYSIISRSERKSIRSPLLGIGREREDFDESSSGTTFVFGFCYGRFRAGMSTHNSEFLR